MISPAGVLAPPLPPAMAVRQHRPGSVAKRSNNGFKTVLNRTKGGEAAKGCAQHRDGDGPDAAKYRLMFSAEPIIFSTKSISFVQRYLPRAASKVGSAAMEAVEQILCVEVQ